MYFERIKASPENTPPTTIPELLGYLRDRVSQVELVYFGTNQIEFINNSTLVVMEASSRNDAEYHYTEYLWWKRIFEKPTLKIRIKVPGGVTLHTLTQIALGETELTQLPCVGCLEHYLTPDWKIVAIPESLSTSAMVLALESDLSWAGWSVGYHPLGFTTNGDTDGRVRYTATKNGVVCTYDLGGNLLPERLLPLGHYENGHTPYLVHGKLIEDKLSTVPAIRRLQIDHVAARYFVEMVSYFKLGAGFVKQEIRDLYDKTPWIEFRLLDQPTETEYVLQVAETGTRIVVNVLDNGLVVQFGSRYFHYTPGDVYTGKHPFGFGLPVILESNDPVEAFEKYYGVSCGWEGWFANCEGK